MNKHPMTLHGAEAIKAELEHLKTVERPRIIEAISQARAHGDLKENAEYHAAREQQSFTEGRIQDLESKISHAQIIDVANLTQDNRVVFGVTVHLVNLDNDQETVYQIVGEDEANLKHGKVSYLSPIARALMGKEVDDVVEVKAPAGIIEYEITKVEYL